MLFLARGFVRKPSFWKIVGAYRSQWKRSIMRFFFPNTYGKKGMGWWHNPRKAAYNWWYNRTSVSAYDFGLFRRSRPSKAFIGCVLGIGLICSLFTLPFDVAKACSTGHKINKARKKRTQANSTHNTTKRKNTGENQRNKAYSTSAANNITSASSPGTTAATSNTRNKKTDESLKKTIPTVPESSEQTSHISMTLTSITSVETYVVPKPHDDEPNEPDENTPKSIPLNEKDQYIRKRMIIAGSYYADQAAVEQLAVGIYFQLVAEPDNPHDKDAIALYYQGCRIGYVAKKDVLPFITCLKLKRSIYGVITDIQETNGRKVFEYETWFASK